MRRELRNEIKNFQMKYPGAESYTSRSLFVRKYEESILKNTKFMGEASMAERIYFLASGLSIIDIICPVCGSKKRFKRPKIGYSNGCCQKHSNGIMSSVLAKEVGPKISAALRARTPEEIAASTKKNKETFKKNHPNTTRADIQRIAYEKHKGSFIAGQKKRLEWIKNNPDKYKNACLKAAKAMKAKVDENGNDHYTRVHLKKLEKDEYGLNFYERQKIKDLTPDENGLNKFDRCRKNMESQGKWIKISELPDYKQYKWLCWHYTKRNDLSILENYEKRGKHYKGENEDVFSLDHIYSIAQGFKNSILPQIIGSIHNLRFLRWDENLAKKDRCDITIEELMDKIQNNK